MFLSEGVWWGIWVFWVTVASTIAKVKAKKTCEWFEYRYDTSNGRKIMSNNKNKHQSLTVFMLLQAH